MLVRLSEDPEPGRLARLALQGVDYQADLARDRRRQPARDRLPMPVDEDVGGDDLEQHERRNQDHQRAPEQGLGKEALDQGEWMHGGPVIRPV